MNVDVPNLLRALQVDYRQRGDELWAPCPYPGHSENEPSWSITWEGPAGQRNGMNHCFGCDRGGSAVKLVQEVIGFALRSSALRWIKDRSLDLDGAAPSAVELRLCSAAGGACAMPQGVRVEPLQRWVTPARRYAQRRGITAQQVQRWGLGHGVTGRCAHRLWLPTYDASGRLRNWTARTYLRSDELRYLDPNETDNANRGAVFGERYWPADPSTEELVLCEGELNALACERAGARYVGAIGGSKVDARQLLRISRFGAVVVATDVDRAGSAAANALRAALSRWRGVRRVAFPAGADPCDVEADRGQSGLAELLCGSAPGG